MVVHNTFLHKVITFFTVLGPGIIVMFADNDAGAVATYTQAGAQYGLHLLWILALLLPVTYFVQEMVVRLGIATGKGHALMIFKKFGRWWGSFSLVDLLIVNFLTLITEFALISLVMSRFGISPYWSVPVIGVGLVALVLTTNYTRWERAMITLCLLDTAWIFLFFMHRNCAALSVIPPVKLSSNLIFLVVAIVGTTVAPWQLFFQQSCVADKKLKFCHLKYERLDTFIGAVLTVTMAGCMMFFGRVVGNHYTDPAGMAVYLSHKLGSTVGFILLILLCDAAILGTVAVSLASAWAYGEVKGWPHSLQLKWRDARGFYSTYTLCVLLAAGIVLIPKMPLQLIIVGVQVLAGIMLPSAIIFLQLLLNDRSLMGEYANKPWNNVINWTVIGVLTALSLILAAQVVTGQR